jgi:hypothetical protein
VQIFWLLILDTPEHVDSENIKLKIGPRHTWPQGVADIGRYNIIDIISYPLYHFFEDIDIFISFFKR